jgi:hypothetical protein
MDKYILGDMVVEKLRREIGIEPKPFPEELKILEGELPSGRFRWESALYQADKLKKISIGKHSHGESGAGAVLMIAAEDEYDLPFVEIDIAFDFGEKDNMFTEFEVIPLVKDEESTRKYVEPFRQWREAIGKLPAKPLTTFGEAREFMKAHVTPIEYIHFLSYDYIDEVLNFADQFLDIFLNICKKAEPVKDAKRRKEMDTFRSEWNKYVLEDDPSGIACVNAFGRQKAELLYNYLVYL